MKIRVTFIIIVLFILLVPVCADEAYEMPDGYSKLEDSIPEDIREYLPKEFFSNDPEEVHSSLFEITDISYIADIIMKLVGIEIKSSIKLLLILSVALVLSSLLNHLCFGFSSGGASEIGKFLSNILMASILISAGGDILSSAEAFFTRLNIFMSGTLPLFCTLSAMGGGLASAVAANYGISSFITISELALGGTVKPIVGACIGLASAGGIADSSAVSSVLGGLKKTYVFLIGMLMTLMLFVFSARGILASSADSISRRAIKFAAGNFIPIVGANIGEILRGVGSSIAYVKNTVGIVSVFIILLMILPVVISVSVRRIVLGICQSIAGILGETDARRLISEFSSIYGMLLAVISMSSVLFLGSVIICVRIGSSAL